MDTRIIDGIANSADSIGVDKTCQDDDFTDRMNHTYTMNVLMFFTAIVLSRQLVGKPISCWIPNDFTGAQGEYAETVCWVTSTYFIPPAQATVPIDEDVRYEKKIYYYQWVPFILMVQAALFVVPCIVWRLFSTQSRINIQTVMEVSTELKSLNESLEQRHDLINCLVRHLEDALAIRHFRRHRRDKKPRVTDQRQYGKGWSQLTSSESKGQESEGKEKPSIGSRFSTPVVPLITPKQPRVPGPRPCQPNSSSYLCGLYLAVKALYLANSATQLCLTGKYLNGNAFIFGIETLRDLMNTRFWDQTGSFPRVALCDFELRRMGSNQHRYTIQCVLRINIFNEKIYIFLWFWFFFVSLLNLLSLLRWCYRLMLSSVRVLFVRNLICIYFNIAASKAQITTKAALENGDKEKQESQIFIRDIFKTKDDLRASRVFSEDILGQDGILLLRFISMNVSPSSAAELAGVIWLKYRKTAASVNRGASSGVEDFIFTNMAAGDKPPTIPPKRRKPASSASRRHVKKPHLMPINPLMHSGRYEDDNDSDRSSDSSRPTIEMLQESKRYKPVHKRRGNYFSDDDRDEVMSTVREDIAPEEFFDNHDVLEAEPDLEVEPMEVEFPSNNDDY